VWIGAMTLNRVTAPARRVRSALCVEHALRGDEQELRVRVTPHAFMSCVQRPRRTLSNVWRPRVAVGCRYWLQIPGDKLSGHPSSADSNRTDNIGLGRVPQT
jgi:hypothetical protein